MSADKKNVHIQYNPQCIQCHVTQEDCYQLDDAAWQNHKHLTSRTKVQVTCQLVATHSKAHMEDQNTCQHFVLSYNLSFQLFLGMLMQNNQRLVVLKWIASSQHNSLPSSACEPCQNEQTPTNGKWHIIDQRWNKNQLFGQKQNTSTLWDENQREDRNIYSVLHQKLTATKTLRERTHDDYAQLQCKLKCALPNW